MGDDADRSHSFRLRCLSWEVEASVDGRLIHVIRLKAQRPPSGGHFSVWDRSVFAQQLSDPQHSISAAWRDYEQFDHIVLPYHQQSG
jgi:hypothetical protein